ncbi:MAG: Na+/H+ antiporter subunit D [Acidimicrobiales bacterium]|nr:MAG: Na+/H+ antiporter subunit D [Acidimicrobiales bacterium]
MIAVLTLAPLLGAAGSIAIGRWRGAQRIVSIFTLLAMTVVSGALVVQVDRQGPIVVDVGGWTAPVGITLVVDRLASIMLAVSMPMLLAVLVFAIGQGGVERTHVGFHPVYLVLASGIVLAFVTGDLFNLFVAFEMTLMSSYVLVTLGGRPEQVRSGMTYVVLNLVGSTLFLLAIGFVYTATGTVNLADLSEKFQDVSPGLRAAVSMTLLVVFGVKAALFPFFFWLPDSYPAAPAPVTAAFAGLLTKVGVYALYRTQTLVLSPDGEAANLLLLISALTMAIGVLGAIAQDEAKRILSFHIISQIGYMIMGLGFFTMAGLAAAIFYVVHHIVVKTTLFLVAGLVEHEAGTGRLDRVSGLAHSAPALGVLFLVPALSLAGFPPTSGFVAKLGLVVAGVEADRYAVVGVSLAVSLLTLFSMVKIWANAFWGEPAPTSRREEGAGWSGRFLMYSATASLVLLGAAVAVAGRPLYSLAERAAGDLLAGSVYSDEVLRR